jgi:hypothetical protein
MMPAEVKNSAAKLSMRIPAEKDSNALASAEF